MIGQPCQPCSSCGSALLAVLHTGEVVCEDCRPEAAPGVAFRVLVVPGPGPDGKPYADLSRPIAADWDALVAEQEQERLIDQAAYSLVDRAGKRWQVVVNPTQPASARMPLAMKRQTLEEWFESLPEWN